VATDTKKKWIGRDDRGSALIAVLLAVFLFGAIGATVSSLTASNLASSTEDFEGSQAFQVAEGGMQWVLMNQLTGDSDFSNNASPTGAPLSAKSIALGSGEFWVEYTNVQPSQMTVKVTSRVGKSVRVVEQQAGQVTQQGGHKEVILAWGNTVLSNSGDIYGDVAMVSGNMTTVGVKLHGTAYQDPKLALPWLDREAYRSMCTKTYSSAKTILSKTTINGNVCYKGNVEIQGNVTVNGLLFVDGEIAVQGSNVTINGSMIATGNISGGWSNNVQFNAGTQGSTHMPALAGHYINFDRMNNLQINGLFWSDRDVTIVNSNNAQITGTLVSMRTITMTSDSNLALTFSSNLLTGIPGFQYDAGTASTTLALSGWKASAAW